MCAIINNNDDKSIEKSILNSFIDISVSLPLTYLSKKIIGYDIQNQFFYISKL
jgi:hypothetical protein